VISYNAGRKRIQAASPSYGSAVSRFEKALARTNDVETAQREAGLSKRGLAGYRADFEKRRPQVSPFEKRGGKWFFRGLQGKTYTFVDMSGAIKRAPFSGHAQIAVQDYRSVADLNSQYALDNWLKKNPAGLVDDNGVLHFPETDLKLIKAVKDRMKLRPKLIPHLTRGRRVRGA